MEMRRGTDKALSRDKILLRRNPIYNKSPSFMSDFRNNANLFHIKLTVWR